MSAPSHTLSATDPVIGLRRKHQALLARIGTDPPGLEERQAFMAELQAAGRFLPDLPGDKRRSAVRNMLFYWAGDATTRGERPKDAGLPQLDDFLGEGSAGAEPQAEVGAPPPEPKPEPKAESAASGTVENVIQTLNAPGPTKSPGLGGMLGSMLGGQSGNSGLSGVLGGLLGGGGKSAPSPDGKSAETAPAQPAGPAASPPPNVPLSDIEEMARARIILRYSGYARQWKLADPSKQSDYLLKGSPLAEASLYVNDDPDIRAHVEASEAARDAARNAEIALRNSRQRQRIAFLSVLVIFAFAMVGALMWKSSQLEEALGKAETERQAAETARVAAVEALNARDKADREKAAAFEVLEDPELRLRQSQRQQVIEPPTASNVSEAPRRPSPPLATPKDVPIATPVAEPCSGYLWLGSPTESRLMGGQSPTALKPGDKAVINLVDDLRLRETAPSFNYQMGRQTGLVPAGSTVTITEVLAPYNRSSGLQYWAQVSVPRQFCTSVFVQYSGTSPTKLEALKSDLLAIGAQTPPAEELPSARGKAEVRYYWAADAPIAQQVATTLGKFTRDGKPLRLTPLTDFPPAAKAQATTIEVWIDLDMLKP